MAQRVKPIQTEKIKVVNIVLYPEAEQKPENYLKYFKNIYEDKVTINTYGERGTRIRTYYESANNKNIIHGDFSNTAFFDPDSEALDSTTNEIVPSNIDPNKGLGLKSWRYYFFADYHRLIFFEKESSEQQILKFLDRAFNQYLSKDNYQINIEKDRNVLDQIINSPSLTRLFVRLSYSNNDNHDGWKAAIDSQLRKSQSRDAKFNFTGTKKEPIDLSNTEMLTAIVELSASNGYAEATDYENNGASRNIKTVDHPLIETISYVDDPTLELEKVVKSISNDERKQS